MLSRINVSIRVKISDEKLANAVFQGVDPENKLAPEKLSLKTKLDNSTIVFDIEGDFKKHRNLKIATIVRTVDDFIWSLTTAFNVAKKVETKDENEGLFESG